MLLHATQHATKGLEEREKTKGCKTNLYWNAI